MSSLVLRRSMIVLIVLIQSAMAFLLIAGHGRFSGRVLIALSPTHGVDSGDLPVVAMWLLGLLAAAALWPRRTAPEHETAAEPPARRGDGRR